MRKTLFLISCCFILCSSFAQMDSLFIGKKETVQVQICRTDVKWNETKTINYEYKPPVNWQIVSFKPVPILKKGNVSYKVSAIRSTGKNKMTANISAKFIELLELASEKNVAAKYDSVIIKMRNDYEKYFDTTEHQYSEIITTGSVSGNRKKSGKTRACLHLDMEVVLTYMPASEEQLLQSLEHFRELINFED